MKIVELTNILRKDSHIYYRREFKADAVIEMMAQTRNVPIEFVLEQTPLGSTEISATIVEDLEYPVVPIIAQLKTHILDMNRRGELP